MSSPFGDLSKLIPADNQFFAGGFGLAALGAGAAILRRSYQVAAQLARRHLLSTLEVTSKDRAFPWVLNWLSTNGHHSQHLSVETSFVSSASSSTATATPSPHAGAVFGFVPGPGMHVVRYRNHWIAVERAREMQSTDLTSGRPWEKVTLTILGRRTDIFTTLLREAFERATRQTEGKTIVYTNWGAEWRPFGQPRRRRPITSVVLDTGVAERVLNDVQEWRRSSRWYIERGIPYRRGYLLYGPPGSGKSSFITAVAGELQYNICILNLAEHGLTDDRLSLALSTVPPQSVILLEDVDAAFVQRDAGNSFSRLTFSGLLNALDGVVSSEERLVFMTTNHLDRLDPALIRPGRVDLCLELGDASQAQIIRLFAKFFPTAAELAASVSQAKPEEPENQVDCSAEEQAVVSTPPAAEGDSVEFARRVQALGLPVSMAQLQGYLLVHKRSPSGALGNLDSLRQMIVNSRAVPKTAEQPPASLADVLRAAHEKQKPSAPAFKGAADIDRMFYQPQQGAQL